MGSTAWELQPADRFSGLEGWVPLPRSPSRSSWCLPAFSAGEPEVSQRGNLVVAPTARR